MRLAPNALVVLLGLVSIVAIIAGVYFGGIGVSKAPPCQHLIGFTQNRDGTLKNVYAPCHKDVCDTDPIPKDCG
jgi:hypothetical protein